MSKLLDEVRNILRVHHYAMKTEKSDVQWIWTGRALQFAQAGSALSSMIYTHVVNRGALGARSPLDQL
jgi:hypothetical protein